jgi:hypothetical protein
VGVTVTSTETNSASSVERSSRTLRLTFITGQRRVLEMTERSPSYATISQRLSKPAVGVKDGLAIIPAIFRPCPVPCRKYASAVRGAQVVNCGGGRLHRLNANVTAMTALGLDLDAFSSRELRAYLDRLRDRDIRFWCYSTFSYSPPERAKARILFPFASPIDIASPTVWTQRLWPELVRKVGLRPEQQGADRSCRDPARLYFLPRVPRADTPFFFEEN